MREKPELTGSLVFQDTISCGSIVETAEAAFAARVGMAGGLGEARLAQRAPFPRRQDSSPPHGPV